MDMELEINKETQEQVLKDIIAHHEAIKAARIALRDAIADNEAVWKKNVLALDVCQFKETVIVRVDDKTYKIDFDYEEFQPPVVLDQAYYTEYFELAPGD